MEKLGQLQGNGWRLTPSTPPTKSVSLPTLPVPHSAPSSTVQPETPSTGRSFQPLPAVGVTFTQTQTGVPFGHLRSAGVPPQLPSHTPPSAAHRPELPIYNRTAAPTAPQLPLHTPPVATNRALSESPVPTHHSRHHNLPEFTPPSARPVQLGTPAGPTTNGRRLLSQQLSPEFHRPSPIRRVTTLNDI